MYFRLNRPAPRAGIQSQTSHLDPSDLSGAARRRRSFRYAGWRGLGLGQATEQSGLARAERLCRELEPEFAKPWCEEAARLRAPRGAADPSVTTEAEAAAERERQAQIEREHTAKKLEAAGVSPQIAQAVRETRDVQYQGPSAQAQVAAARAAAVVRTPRAQPIQDVQQKVASDGGGALTPQDRDRLLALAAQRQPAGVSGGTVAAVAVASVVGLGILVLALRR